MALSRAKYRRVPELYVKGTTVELLDGTPIWLQVLNPLERDEAIHDAQVARARMTMAIKEGDEREKVVATLAVEGRDASIERLVDYRVQQELPKIIEALQNDPEWTERLDIMARGEDILSRAPEDAERALLTKINEDYLTEIVRRQTDERDFQKMRLQSLSDEELLEDYADAWTERRGSEVAQAEYALTEIWYAARACEGVIGEDGTWSHDACEGHALQIFETKREVRDLPEELYELLVSHIAELNMSVRDARFSARQGSSSDSSPLPSEPEESTPSTPTATFASVPGT